MACCSILSYRHRGGARKYAPYGAGQQSAYCLHDANNWNAGVHKQMCHLCPDLQQLICLCCHQEFRHLYIYVRIHICRYKYICMWEYLYAYNMYNILLWAKCTRWHGLQKCQLTPFGGLGRDYWAESWSLPYQAELGLKVLVDLNFRTEGISGLGSKPPSLTTPSGRKCPQF